ncbi:hypothetical protein GCM10028856_23820 [Halopiger thermotolerans]
MLASAASAGVGVTAACLSDRDEYATLQSLSFINSTDEPARVDFRIERAATGEIVHTDTRDVAAGAWRVVDCVWPDAPLTVNVRHVDGDWNAFTTVDETGCMGIIANIRGPSPSFLTHHSECPIPDSDCYANVTD